MHYTIHTDGGARGNPGPAGIGAVIESQGRKILLKKFIGPATNNQAEYQALILALEHILADMAGQGGLTTIYCFLDSELIVQQLNGKYKIKNEGLKPLYQQVQSLIGHFHEVKFQHLPRSENQEADLLVNQAIDQASRL